MTDSAAVSAAITEASRDTVRLPSVDLVYVPLWARGGLNARNARPISSTTVTVNAADGTVVTVTVSTTSSNTVSLRA